MTGWLPACAAAAAIDDAVGVTGVDEMKKAMFMEGFAEGERVVRERLAAATTASITERHAALAAEAAAAAAAGEAVEAEAAAATVAKLKSRLVTIPSQHVLCEEERGGAVLCFRQHAKDDVTQCRGTVEAFERCARHVKEQHVAAAAAKELKATPAHE